MSSSFGRREKFLDARLALHRKHLPVYRETIVAVYTGALVHLAVLSFSLSFSGRERRRGLPFRHPFVILPVWSARLKNVLKNQNSNAFIATLARSLAHPTSSRSLLEKRKSRHCICIYACGAAPHRSNAFLASSTTGALRCFVHDPAKLPAKFPDLCRGVAR